MTMHKKTSIIMASAITAILTTFVFAFAFANQAFAQPPVMLGSGPWSVGVNGGVAAVKAPGVDLSAGSGAAAFRVPGAGVGISAGHGAAGVSAPGLGLGVGCTVCPGYGCCP
jgi:hypothetical protein